MTKDETMMSLYDYRGHKDTNKEGQRVYAKAKEQGITVQSRELAYEKYKGLVMTYPKWFLDEHFHPTIELTAKDTQDDDLPF